MKIRFFCALMALSLLCARPANADVRGCVAERVLVRLHVVAHSDSSADQQTKLRVRDAVREVAAPIAAQGESPEEAFALLRANIASLTCAARAIDGSAVVEAVERQAFPMRIYGHAVVPAGHYRAIRVTLGEGGGRNWWCVIYPDLCASDAASSSALREGKPIRFYSSLLRWIFEGSEAQ